MDPEIFTKIQINIFNNIISRFQARDLWNLCKTCKTFLARIISNDQVLIDLMRDSHKNFYQSRSEDSNKLVKRKIVNSFKNNHLPTFSILTMKKRDHIMSTIMIANVEELLRTIILSFCYFRKANMKIILPSIIKAVVSHWSSLQVIRIVDMLYGHPYYFNIGIIAHYSPNLASFKIMMSILNVSPSNVQAYHIILRTSFKHNREIFEYGVKMLQDTSHLIGQIPDQLTLSDFVKVAKKIAVQGIETTYNISALGQE